MFLTLLTQKMRYNKGDVILVLFPYREKNQVKLRPALILEVLTDAYKICQITKTDSRPRNNGVWIEKTSKAGKKMKLRFDSFINLAFIINITEAFIQQKIGFYPDVDKLSFS